MIVSTIENILCEIKKSMYAFNIIFEEDELRNSEWKTGLKNYLE